MTIKKIFSAGALALPLVLVAADATVRETTVEMKTYPFFDPDPVPATDKTRYPYFFIDGTSSAAEPKVWKAVILENDFITVTILPEIGGKIWGAKDKETGRDFIYHNHVVKFRNIAQRGPWCSGGIEFNFGIIGHGPWTAAPVSYAVRTNPDGSASCFVSDTELVTRTTWQVEINLPSDRAGFLTRTTWFNGSGLREPYYQWMNAAFPVRGNPRFEYPGRAYIGHDGRAADWPIDPDGHDLSLFTGNAFGGAKSEHVLCGDNGFYGIWWQDWNLGATHRNHLTQKYGRKVWLWPLSRSGGIWEDLLTDEDGQYTELQSGRAFNQPAGNSVETPFKELGFAAGTTDTFEEEWSVVHDRAVFAHCWDETNNVARPLKTPADYTADTPYAHYLIAESRHNQARYADAEKELDVALAAEPYLLPALSLKASLAVRRGDFAAVHRWADKALSINTYDAEANYADALAFAAEGKTRAARERFGIAAYAPAFRAAAFVEVAKIELKERNWSVAEAMADKALAADALNQDARLVKIIVARKQGACAVAKARIDSALSETPLFFGARFEANLLNPATEPVTSFIRNEFPHEPLISLASWYEDAGLADEARQLYARAEKDSLIAAIRLAHLTKDAAKLATLTARPIAFVLPFRRETLPALEWAAKTNSNWKFRYLLGVLYAAKGRAAEADRELEACGNEPDDAVFYLYRASRRTDDAALADLRKAEKLDSTSWRVGYALYNHFAAKRNWAQAEKVAATYLKAGGSNKLRIAYATALVANRKPRAAIDYLNRTEFLPSEHGDSASAAWIDANRLLAEEALAKGDRIAAKAFVKAALSFPEKLGLGKPYVVSYAPVQHDRNPFADWSEALRDLAREVDGGQ